MKADSRYGQLTAVSDGAVWTNTKALGPGGGNDYFERGCCARIWSSPTCSR